MRVFFLDAASLQRDSTVAAFAFDAIKFIIFLYTKKSHIYMYLMLGMIPSVKNVCQSSETKAGPHDAGAS